MIEIGWYIEFMRNKR